VVRKSTSHGEVCWEKMGLLLGTIIGSERMGVFAGGGVPLKYSLRG
jgi:hypothetical protein